MVLSRIIFISAAFGRQRGHHSAAHAHFLSGQHSIATGNRLVCFAHISSTLLRRPLPSSEWIVAYPDRTALFWDYFRAAGNSAGTPEFDSYALNSYLGDFA
jgi:hypothetical protein